MISFKFNKKVSKIIDFYRLLEFSNEAKEDSDIFYQKIKETGYIDIVNNFYKKHTKLKENYEIMSYGGLNPFSLFNLFTIDELLEFESIEEVRDELFNKDELEIRGFIIKSLVDDNENVSKYLDNSFEVFSLIEESNFDNDLKVRILSAISKPRKALEEYLNFIFSFRDDFEKVYEENKDIVFENAKKYEKVLNENGFEYIYEITDYYLDNMFDYIKEYKNINLIVSMFAPIGVGFNTEENILVLGIYCEKMQEIKKAISSEIRVEVFKNLGDETRFKIYNEIAKGVGTNKELAKICGVSKPTISYHINHLINSCMIGFDENSNYVIKKEMLENVFNEFLDELGN